MNIKIVIDDLEGLRMSKMKLKTIVAVVIILVVAPPLYFGGNLLQVLLILVSALGSLEIASLTDQKKHWFLSLMTLAAVMAMYYQSFNVSSHSCSLGNRIICYRIAT